MPISKSETLLEKTHLAKTIDVIQKKISERGIELFEDQEKVQEIVKTRGCAMPNVKMSVYKNRRGQWNRIYVWMDADKGTCRFNPVFVTDYQYGLVEVPALKINIREESAF